MASLLAGLRDSAKMVGSGVGVAVGAGLTVATAGQAQWTKDMTEDYADVCARSAASSGKNYAGFGIGAVNTLKTGSLGPLAEQMYGMDYPEKHRQGYGHEQLQAYLVKQTSEQGRWYNMQHMADHLRDNGAHVQRMQNVYKCNVRDFLCAGPSNLYWNKLLYFTGHGNSHGEFRMHEGSSEWLTIDDVLQYVQQGGFAGVLTIIVDSCYSGMWVRRMIDILNSPPDYMRQMHAHLDRNPDWHLRIRLRTSCLKGEISTRRPTGSSYTQCLIARMGHESVRANGSGNNWGVHFARNHNAGSSDVCFGISTADPQTDLAVDFDYNGKGSWSWNYPSDREGYL